jgi:hypothetical protein
MVAGVCPAYLPNIHYMAWVVSHKEIALVTHNPYQKQTFRNRTEIFGANGKLKLTIPIVHSKTKERQIDEVVAIYYENNWQKRPLEIFGGRLSILPFF